MPGKTFEEQVRQELIGLRLEPSQQVWETLAVQLQQKHKRRRIFWLLMLMLCLLGASGWWWIQHNNDLAPGHAWTTHADNSTATKTTTTTTTPILPERIQPDTTPSTVISQTTTIPAHQNRDKNDYAGTADQLPVKLLNRQAPRTNTSVSQSGRHTLPVGNHHKSALSQDLQREAVPENIVIKDQKSQPIQAQDNRIKQSVTAAPAFRDTVVISEDSKKAVVSAVLRLPPSDTTATEKNTRSADTAALPVPTHQPVDSTKASVTSATQSAGKSGWSWAVQVLGGWGGTRKSIGSLFAAPDPLRAYNPIGSGSPGSGAGSGGTATGTIPVVRDGASLGFGVAIEKKIGRKQRHLLGLSAGYHFYTTQLKVGARTAGTLLFNNFNVSNQAGYYFASRDSLNYTNYYHFLEAAVQYYIPFSFLKANMRWHTSLGINYLLTSNGLHYDYSGNAAYLFQNNSLFNRLQLNTGSGLDIQVGRKKPVWAGLQVDYMLGNLSKQALSDQHLFRISAILRIPLQKPARK